MGRTIDSHIFIYIINRYIYYIENVDQLIISFWFSFGEKGMLSCSSLYSHRIMCAVLYSRAIFLVKVQLKNGDDSGSSLNHKPRKVTVWRLFATRHRTSRRGQFADKLLARTCLFVCASCHRSKPLPPSLQTPMFTSGTSPTTESWFGWTASARHLHAEQLTALITQQSDNRSVCQTFMDLLVDTYLPQKCSKLHRTSRFLYSEVLHIFHK